MIIKLGIRWSVNIQILFLGFRDLVWYLNTANIMNYFHVWFQPRYYHSQPWVR